VGLRNVVRNGRQNNGTQKYKCRDCGRYFVRTIHTPFFRKHLAREEIAQICRMLAERNSFRGIARSTEHHLDTIRVVADVVAKHCKKFNNFFITELKLTPVEVDEMWSFVKKKKSIALRRNSKRVKLAMRTPTSGRSGIPNF